MKGSVIPIFRILVTNIRLLVSQVMQELAGHARIATTMGVYSHVNMDAKREAMKTVSDVF